MDDASCMDDVPESFRLICSASSKVFFALATSFLYKWAMPLLKISILDDCFSFSRPFSLSHLSFGEDKQLPHHRHYQDCLRALPARLPSNSRLRCRNR